MFAIPMAMISTSSSVRRLLKRITRKLVGTRHYSHDNSSAGTPLSIANRYRAFSDKFTLSRNEEQAVSSRYYRLWCHVGIRFGCCVGIRMS